MKNLKGRVCAITGAASGIGRSLAVAMAKEGTKLALADLDAAALHETALLIKQQTGAEPSEHIVDVANEQRVNAYADEVLRKWGQVDMLVNNAGVGLYGSVLEMSTDDFKWLMDINFWGVVYGARAFLPYLLRRPEASIVNISSLFGLWAPPGQSAYAASKFAVRGFSESLRAELQGTPVHVVTVHPAGVATAIARCSRVAAKADPLVAEAEKKAFEEQFLRMPADKAAAIILRGIARNQDRVLIGWEAKQVDLLHRIFGHGAMRLLDKLARFDPSRNTRFL